MSSSINPTGLPSTSTTTRTSDASFLAPCASRLLASGMLNLLSPRIRFSSNVLELYGPRPHDEGNSQSDHLSGTPCAANPERVPLKIRQQKYKRDEVDTEEESDQQHNQAAGPHVNQAANQGKSHPGNGHHHTAEQV